VKQNPRLPLATSSYFDLDFVVLTVRREAGQRRLNYLDADRIRLKSTRIDAKRTPINVLVERRIQDAWAGSRLVPAS